MAELGTFSMNVYENKEEQRTVEEEEATEEREATGRRELMNYRRTFK